MVLKKIENYLRENNYKTPLSISDFIVEVSNIYHKYESEYYDSLHQTMFNVSSKYLHQIIDDNIDSFEEEIILLDYGCGTGYATRQLLNSKISGKITKIVCYDLSKHMINKCRENLKKESFNMRGINFSFYSGKEGLEKLKELEFNVIITNALLHHLLDLQSFFNFLDTSLKINGIYIAGHEPNNTYYSNKKLIYKTKQFQKYKRIVSKFKLNYILNKLKWKNNFFPNIIDKTNKSLICKGLIDRKIPNFILPKLVDIHVPIGVFRQQVWGEIGFSPSLIINKYNKHLNEIDFISYFHIKDYKVYSSSFWKTIMKKLEVKYPNDGADCIMMFKKKK